jgi:hypothetical protein
MPLQDGLNLGLEESEQQRVKCRLHEIAAQKLGRHLLAGAANSADTPVVDVALPCLDKRMSLNRGPHWRNLDGSAEFGGFAQAIAAGWMVTAREESEPPRMEWSHVTEMTGVTAKAILTSLLDAYERNRGELPWWRPDANYAVEFHVSLDGAAAAGWYQLGAERTYDFFRSLARVSGAAQRAIRRWLPVLWLSDGELFDRPREAAALLGYCSLPPVLARSRRNYTYDPLDAGSLRQALALCGRRIQRQLQIWQPVLSARNHESAEVMHPRWHSKWAVEFKRRCKRIQTLLANEAWLIDQFVNFAAEFQLHASQAGLMGTVRRARAMHAALEGRFRRWWEGRQAMELTGLVLLEATSALSDAPVDLTVIMRQIGTSGEPPVPIVLRASRRATALEDAPRSSEAA